MVFHFGIGSDRSLVQYQTRDLDEVRRQMIRVIEKSEDARYWFSVYRATQNEAVKIGTVSRYRGRFCWNDGSGVYIHIRKNGTLDE